MCCCAPPPLPLPKKPYKYFFRLNSIVSYRWLNILNNTYLFISGAEPHVNTCYKHFYYFVTEFDLINEKEFAPLSEMTRRICTDIIAPPTPTGLTCNIFVLVFFSLGSLMYKWILPLLFSTWASVRRIILF